MKGADLKQSEDVAARRAMVPQHDRDTSFENGTRCHTDI